jgi:hypothetical protein
VHGLLDLLRRLIPVFSQGYLQLVADPGSFLASPNAFTPSGGARHGNFSDGFVQGTLNYFSLRRLLVTADADDLLVSCWLIHMFMGLLNSVKGESGGLKAIGGVARDRPDESLWAHNATSGSKLNGPNNFYEALSESSWNRVDEHVHR